MRIYTSIMALSLFLCIISLGKVFATTGIDNGIPQTNKDCEKEAMEYINRMDMFPKTQEAQEYQLKNAEIVLQNVNCIKVQMFRELVTIFARAILKKYPI